MSWISWQEDLAGFRAITSNIRSSSGCTTCKPREDGAAFKMVKHQTLNYMEYCSREELEGRQALIQTLRFSLCLKVFLFICLLVRFLLLQIRVSYHPERASDKKKLSIFTYLVPSSPEGLS